MRKHIHGGAIAALSVAVGLLAGGSGAGPAAADTHVGAAAATRSPGGIVARRIVPSGCTTKWNVYFESRDAKGKVVDKYAIHSAGRYDWSKSGDSVGLHNVSMASSDGKNWVLTVDRYDGGVSGGPYNGPRGTITPSFGVSWTPAHDLWIKEGTPQASWHLTAHNKAHPTEHVTGRVLTCP